MSTSIPIVGWLQEFIPPRPSDSFTPPYIAIHRNVNARIVVSETDEAGPDECNSTEAGVWGLREIEGPTPAQVALAETKAESLPPEQQILEDRLNDLLELIERVMNPELAGQYVDLVLQFSGDQVVDGVTYLGMQRAPAARGNHHAFEGGLVFHLTEMWRVWVVLRTSFPEMVLPPYVTDERVLCAIINHDLHKADRCYIQVQTADGSWKVEYGKHVSDRLTNATLHSVWMLNQAGIHPDIEQLHALGLAQGSWSDQTGIREASVLAKLCYLLDESSANVLGRIAVGTLLQRDIPISSSSGTSA